MSTAQSRTLDDLLVQFQHIQNSTVRLLQLQQSSLKAIQDNDLTTAEAVLKQKQPLINELLETRKLHNLYEKEVKSNPTRQCEQIESVINKIDTCLEAVRKLEQETISLVQSQHRSTAEKLQKLVRSHSTSKSYHHAKHSPLNSRIDLSG